MPATPAITLALLVGLWPFHASQVQTNAYSLPVWGFSESKDRFTGKVECDLYEGSRRHPQVSYSNGALSFHFSPRVNTLTAEYRIDGGPARRWQDDFPKLVQVNAPLQNGSMSNPTGGLVVVPATELAGAHTVMIRVTPKGPPRLFTIDGFPNALEAAQARGCADSAFTR